MYIVAVISVECNRRGKLGERRYNARDVVRLCSCAVGGAACRNWSIEVCPLSHVINTNRCGACQRYIHSVLNDARADCSIHKAV